MALCPSGLNLDHPRCCKFTDKPLLAGLNFSGFKCQSTLQTILIDHTEKVKLVSGEEAYLSGVSFEMQDVIFGRVMCSLVQN